MKNNGTYMTGPCYLTSGAELKQLSELHTKNNYAAGVIVHELDRIPRRINQLHKLSNPWSAPHYQITKAAFEELKRFAEKLEPFTALHHEWNDSDSSAPTVNAVAMAIGSCLALIQSGIPSPTPKIHSKGVLGGYWRLGNAYAAIDFEDDGEHIWTVTDGKDFTSGTWKVGEKLPQAINLITSDEK